MADFNSVIQIAPTYPVAYVSRGEIYRGRGDHAAALADFSKALALDERYPLAYHNRGLVEQALGRHVEAVQDFDQAIALKPGDTPPLYARGVSNLALQRFTAAADDFEQVIEINPQLYRGALRSRRRQPASGKMAGGGGRLQRDPEGRAEEFRGPEGPQRRAGQRGGDRPGRRRRAAGLEPDRTARRGFS